MVLVTVASQDRYSDGQSWAFYPRKETSMKKLLRLLVLVPAIAMAPSIGSTDTCFAGTDCTTAPWVGMRCCWSEPDPRLWVGCRTVCQDYQCDLVLGCPDIQHNGMD